MITHPILGHNFFHEPISTYIEKHHIQQNVAAITHSAFVKTVVNEVLSSPAWRCGILFEILSILFVSYFIFLFRRRDQVKDQLHSASLIVLISRCARSRSDLLTYLLTILTYFLVNRHAHTRTHACVFMLNLYCKGYFHELFK